MGGILELTEYLKSPVGLIAVVAFCAGLYYFVKWVMAEDDEEKKEE